MNTKLKSGILVVLLSWAPLPMDEKSLISAVQAYARPGQPAVADVLEALKDVEAGGYVAGAWDDFTKSKSWTLTDLGVHQARKVR